MLFYFYFRHIRRYAHDVPWIHLGIGLVGNFCFVVGSLFFLSPTLTRAGTWLFVVASWGLLIGVCGEILARYEGRQRQKATAVPADHVAAGPVPADPVTAGPVTAGPVTAGPVTAGPVTAEKVTADRRPASLGPTDTQPRPRIAREA